MTQRQEIFRKHNSFLAILQKHPDAEQRARERLRAAAARPDLLERLEPRHRAILARALDDLRGEGSATSGPRFALTPNVAAEVNSLPEDALPRYLVHRYRYEIFPQRQELDDFPPYLQIEPSSMCNFRCVFCYETDKTFTRRSSGHMGYMSVDLFRRVVDQAVGRVEFLSLASRGEPLLCPGIEEMLAYTRGKFLNLKINTNASLLTEAFCHAILQSGIKTVVFSADAAVEPLYSRLRVGGKLAKVLENVERFQRIRVTQYPASSVITRVSGVKYCDEQQLDSMHKFWGGFVDQVAFVAYNPWENIYQLPANGVSAPCSDLWRRMFVWWDGKINPCDVDYKSTLSVGNSNDCTLSDAWTSEPYQVLRAAHLDARRQEWSPCKGCSVV